MNTTTMLRNSPTRHERQGLTELLLVAIATLLFPPILLMGFFVVNPREEIVVLRFGKYVGTITTPGIRWIHPVGRELRDKKFMRIVSLAPEVL